MDFRKNRNNDQEELYNVCSENSESNVVDSSEAYVNRNDRDSNTVYSYALDTIQIDHDSNNRHYRPSVKLPDDVPDTRSFQRKQDFSDNVNWRLVIIVAAVVILLLLLIAYREQIMDFLMHLIGYLFIILVLIVMLIGLFRRR